MDAGIAPWVPFEGLTGVPMERNRADRVWVFPTKTCICHTIVATSQDTDE